MKDTDIDDLRPWGNARTRPRQKAGKGRTSPLFHGSIDNSPVPSVQCRFSAYFWLFDTSKAAFLHQRIVNETSDSSAAVPAALDILPPVFVCVNEKR